MKAKLNRIIQSLIELRDREHDDEVSDEIDNALIHLDAASDRLIQMDEEDDAADEDEALTQQWVDSRLPNFDLP
jgi:glycogen debranching enzyme